MGRCGGDGPGPDPPNPLQPKGLRAISAKASPRESPNRARTRFGLEPKWLQIIIIIIIITITIIIIIIIIIVVITIIIIIILVTMNLTINVAIIVSNIYNIRRLL